MNAILVQYILISDFLLRTDLERVEKALQEITLQRTETATHCSYRLQPLKDTYFHSDHIEQDELLRGSPILTYLLWESLF